MIDRPLTVKHKYTKLPYVTKQQTEAASRQIFF